MMQNLQVSFTKDSLIIETVTPGTGGATTKGHISYSLDGKPYRYTSIASKRKLVRTYAISVDQNTITLTTVFYIPEKEDEIDFTRVETWTVVNGQLVIHKKSIEKEVKHGK